MIYVSINHKISNKLYIQMYLFLQNIPTHPQINPRKSEMQTFDDNVPFQV